MQLNFADPNHTYTKQTADDFVDTFDEIAAYINNWAERKGWNDDDPSTWNFGVSIDQRKREAMIVAHDLSKVALMDTELAEAMEGIRHGNPPSDKIPVFSAVEEELADCIIRIMHFAQQRKYRIAQALLSKLTFNETRPYKHGKKA